MPQLEQIDTYLGQVFWLAVTFALLYLVLWRAALPRITRVLTQRQERMDEDLRKAEKLREEAAGVLAAYEEAAARARAEAQSILRESAEAFAARAAGRHEELGRRIAGEAAAGEGRIEAARAAALENVGAIAADLAEAATARLTGQAQDRQAVETGVAVALAERR